MTYEAGWVYVLSNQSFPKWLKIGFTTRSVERRIVELAVAGVPYNYICVLSCLVSHPATLEGKVHELLKHRRVEKEFFEASIDEIAAAIRRAVQLCELKILDHIGPLFGSASTRYADARATRFSAAPVPPRVDPVSMSKQTAPLAEGQLTTEVSHRGKASVSLRWVPLNGNANHNK